MLSLNLLSPLKRQQAANQTVLLSLQSFISWALIAICIAGMILLITKLIMQNSFNQAVKQGALVTQEYGTLNQKVYLANKKIAFLKSLQTSFIVWSPKFAELTSLAPNDIMLYSVNINHTTRDLQISGHAKIRDDLLIYKKQLEESKLLSQVELPIENLLESKNIDFTIRGKLAL
ncbi:hypothetical protein ACFL29_01860 [Patescibacteria group bacterium]